MGNKTIRLMVMMFLQFFIWGAWYVTAPIYLRTIGFFDGDIGWTYSVGPIAGIISPFFVGMIADRFFSTEKILAVLHLAGGGLMLIATSMMQVDDPSPTIINLLFFGHMLCFFPTLALTNTLALHNMDNAEKQFPMIRVFGTIGWIIAGVYISSQGWDAAVDMFTVAGIASLAMGAYSFTLPHTPPPSKGQKVSMREILGLDALVLLKKPAYLTFMVSSFLICIPLSFYYQMAGEFAGHAGLAYPAFKMSFGQMSEIIFMVLMPLFFVRLGVKWMLAVGMLAWVARYALFAVGADGGAQWMILSGILLHGICYDFFFVTGQIYTDKIAPKAIRGQAQGMLVLFTLGIGMFIGAKVAGEVKAANAPTDSVALAEEAKAMGEEIDGLQSELDEVYGMPEEPSMTDKIKRIFPPTLDGDNEKKATEIIDEMEELSGKRSEILMKSVNWKPIWTIPAVGAAAILLLFVLLFKDDSKAGDSNDTEAADNKS